MKKSIKFTVSIPWKEYEEMEDSRRRESAIKSYVAGYRGTPEDPALAEALAREAAEILPAEDWT
jgi:hypothetical protein